MKRQYDGLEAEKINLNSIDTLSGSNCNKDAELEDTGSGTCDYCNMIEQQYEGYTQEV